MNTNTDDLISVTELGNNTSKYINEAANGRTWVVLRNNATAAVVTSPSNMDRLQRLDGIEEDLQLLTAVLARMATDSGKRHRLEDVAADFGVDLGEGE